MLDIRLLRESPDYVRAELERRHSTVDITPILELDALRRSDITNVDALKNERNSISKQIGVLKKNGEDTTDIQQKVRDIGDEISFLDNRIRETDAALRGLLLAIPNLPHESVPSGKSAEDNVVVREWGTRREFTFQPKPHWEIGEALGLFDFERAVKLSGAGFPLYTGVGARLERALIQFMLDLHTQEHGYTEVSPPFVVNTETMTGTGQLPKMADDMYYAQSDDLWLIPTAEVPVTNIHRDEIIRRDLPVQYVAYTPCFRREAGAAGKDTRGLIRIHQFDKVEMVKFVPPETSYDELEKLVANAEAVFQKLNLPYRVLLLCAGDMSFGAAKCYDLELWAPGHNGWLEDSSCSCYEAFQARRANIRFRNAEGKTEFVHTLNGSGVALSRLVVALLENGQQEDGSVILPEAIRPYMGGMERIVAP